MTEVTETQLPGVGVRYEFTTARGDRVGVVSHRGGRREVIAYDRDDPDRCRTLLDLDRQDARTVTELLGASQVTEAVAGVQQQVEGLAIDWVTVPDDSPSVGSTLGDGEFRTRTGVSIVALVRRDETVPAPGPDMILEAADVLVAVGTPDGLDQLRAFLRA